METGVESWVEGVLRRRLRRWEITLWAVGLTHRPPQRQLPHLNQVSVRYASVGHPAQHGVNQAGVLANQRVLTGSVASLGAFEIPACGGVLLEYTTHNDAS